MSHPSYNQMEDTEQPQIVREEGTSSFAAEVWDWMKSILFALIIVFIIHQFIFNLSTVRGHSMQPSLWEDEWLFVNKFGYIAGHPHSGDVVILKDPSQQLGKREYLVKRVIGEPGDKVEIHDDTLYLNGAVVEEPYTDVGIEDGDYGPLVVPPKHYFVMGDNRHRMESKDSRIFGAVPENMIKGKAQFILWPIRRMAGL